MKQDIAEIAEKLTPAQWAMLRRHRPTYGSPEEGWAGSALRDAYSFKQAGRPLMDAGLISWTDDRRSSATRITKLGAHLLAHSHPEKQA